jgi:putative oxidoreductase
MMQSMNNIGALVGRVLLALIFTLSGFMKLIHLGGTAAMMQHQGIPMAGALALAAAVIEFGGGILLMIGLTARPVALILFLYLIPVTIIFHIMPGGMMNQINTMKNFAIMGGLLIVASQGAGGLSIDSVRGRAAPA